jgi:DNA-binding transcriptional regulator YiaG
MSRRQTAESFWARVQGDRRKRNGCWEWQGSCNSTGYGTVGWHGKNYTAHRVSAWLSGLIKDPAAPKTPKEKSYVLHKCDNRKCCNPTHFFIGSYSDNQLDAYTKKRKVQPKGGNHVNAKLTNKQAVEIRRAYEVHGLTQKQLANKFDVSQRTISLIVRGETYK